jgi:hypothetical protein
LGSSSEGPTPDDVAGDGEADAIHADRREQRADLLAEGGSAFP